MAKILKTALLSVSGAAVFLACNSSNPSSGDGPGKQPGPPELRFLNSVQQTDLIGNTTLYRVRNVTALDSTWSEEIAFGEYSSYKLIVPQSTDFPIDLQIRPEAGGNWLNLSLTERMKPDTGGPFTVELKFGE